MQRRTLSLLLWLGVLGAPAAWASFDMTCSPTWSMANRHYNRCSNLSMLGPGNDSQVNLQLLLLDAGHAKIGLKPVRGDDVTEGYGRVPFSVESFNASMNPDEEVIGESATDAANDSYEAYGVGEGSRCQSNKDGDAAGAFIAALKTADELPEAEREALGRSRSQLMLQCGDGITAISVPASIHSSAGQQFVGYISAAGAFYSGDYSTALLRFSELNGSTQPWLKEAALYMIGRTELNRAQQNAFDEDGFVQLDHVDDAALDAAEHGLADYLQKYPKGDYAASAKGLLRRVYWLKRQPEQLANAYAWQLAQNDPELSNISQAELVQEVDSKLLMTAKPADIKDPQLLAIVDLMQMRGDSSSPNSKYISLTELQAQQPLFVANQPLYAYLLAAHRFYVANDPTGALKELPDSMPSTSMSYLDFSRLSLRGLALEASGDTAAARKLWLQLLPLAKQPLQRPQLELALAMNEERGGDLSRVFDATSPIQESAIREILLRHGASAELLRERIKASDADAHERDLALFVLLYKDLMRGRYQDFLSDYPLLPANAAGPVHAYDFAFGGQPPLGLFHWAGTDAGSGYACPSLRAVAQLLQKDPANAHGMNCLGEFIRVNELDGFSLDRQPDKSDLGGAPTQFPGTPYSRQEGYKKIIADNAAAPTEKAYALYRAINCYGPSGYNSCGGKDVDKNQRKAWFQALKSRYADTGWADDLKYYW